MVAQEKRILRQVADALVNDDRVEPDRAAEAVARAAKATTVGANALEIYRAARRILRIDPATVPPPSSAVFHTPVQPVRSPPPRKGTRKDTPAAKKR